MNNASLFIADADALVSLTNSQDANHTRAMEILHFCIAQQTHILFPTTAICEATTVLHRKLNNPEGAARVIAKTLTGEFRLLPVGEKEITAAAQFFRPEGSKKDTLFDAVIAAIAYEQGADAIFSFDGWYSKLGLLLAGDFIEAQKQVA